MIIIYNCKDFFTGRNLSLLGRCFFRLLIVGLSYKVYSFHMGQIIFANIKPELLIWARSIACMSEEYVSQKLKISIEKLNTWESGEKSPTIKQLRKIAKLYNQAFATFFLPTPPIEEIPIPHDFRRFAGSITPIITPELALDIRNSWERREIVIDLLTEEGESPEEFTKEVDIQADPETIGTEIRQLLNITYDVQKQWHDSRIAFNYYRETLEEIGLLVFQTHKINLSEIRGYSISNNILPVIVINRKDNYFARIFTLLHEFSHILLRMGGLCDLVYNVKLTPESSKIEVFCNHVAGAAIIPKENLLSEFLVKVHGVSSEWSDEEISDLSTIYCASREVIVRRLLILGLTTKGFYEDKRKQYQKDIPRLPKHKGYVTPSVDLVSQSGKKYVRTILDALNGNRISYSDISDYFGVRTKHLDKIAGLVSKETQYHE